MSKRRFMSTNKALESFGEDFITNIRDVSLENYEMIQKGLLKSDEAKLLHESLSRMSKENLEIIKKVVLNIVDRTIHKTLFLFESSENWAIVIKDEAEKAKIENLVDISDGLSGELYGKKGWIEKYSKYK